MVESNHCAARIDPDPSRAQRRDAVIKTSVEYVGFRNTEDRREYHLRSHCGTETHDFTVGIALQAFADGRARVQDGPEISYLKLQREIGASENPLRQRDFTVSDGELIDYRDGHSPARKRP
jgi:hypothetical protein